MKPLALTCSAALRCFAAFQAGNLRSTPTQTVEVLLQRILRHEQINLRTLQHVLDTFALVAEGRRKVEHRPSIVLALLDFARRTTAALIFGNESCQRLALFSDEDVVFNCVDCSSLIARWTRPSEVSNACPALYVGASPQPSSIFIAPDVTTL